MTNTKNQPGRPRTAAKSMFHLTPETQGVYKATLAAVILVVGLLAVRLPFGMRLDAARANRDQQQRLVEDLLEVQAMMDVARVYRERLTEADDVVVWQEYVQRQLELAGGRLLEFVPGVPISSGNFKILDLEIRATGDYSQLADFVDRLERSEHLIRIDDLGVMVESGWLTLTAKVRILTGTSVLDLLDEEEVEA
ncbi:MAG: hypothetical protein H8E31_03205 [Planctomycetes bacterium]|nr:hypothetical protein [Planctomycetota bacterium]